ncbi:hypothetical protein ACHAWO_013841 [Cyclotella atomus]|uniref:Sulfotransferase domain-containing protein n=1 Tax=Cyclotella atomus TaxID=382360 RepID=A0ABD3QIL9_9STRA
MSTHRRSHHHTSSSRRRSSVSDPADTISVASSDLSKTPASPAGINSLLHVLVKQSSYSGAGALVLAFCVFSFTQFSNILVPPQPRAESISPLRRSLQEENFNSQDYLIPIVDPSSSKDVGILWQESPFALSVNSYYQCMGKRITGKIEQNGAMSTHVDIQEDWTDAMAKLALMPADISGLVKSGEVDDLLVATDQPMAAVKSLLSEKQKGKILGIFHHPVESVAFLFSQLNHSENIPQYREKFIANMESDLLVKKIVGIKPTDEVSVADLKVAMDFVREYVVVGLMSEQEESIRRFNKALGLDTRLSSNCTAGSESVALDEEQRIAPNSAEWNAISMKSPLDMMLYKFMEKLFEEQVEIFDESYDLATHSDQVLWNDTFNPSHLADFDGSYPNELETPFLWHVPRSGGSHVQDFYWCLGSTLANQVGGEPRFNKIVPRHLLKEFQPWKEHGNEAKVLNVDMSTRNGIVHAKSLGLLSQKDVPKPDLIFSTQFYYLSTILFSSQHKARVFSLFRHPVDRAFSRFRSLQTVNKAWANLSVEEWAAQDNDEANWMVRQLVHKNQDETVTIKDLDAAKAIVRDKFVVGLCEKYQESLHRFNKLLGIDIDDAKYAKCVQAHGISPEGSAKVAKGSPAYVTLMSVNFLDAMLYQYVEELFESQGELFNY